MSTIELPICHTKPVLSDGALKLIKKSMGLMLKELYSKHGEITDRQRELFYEIGTALDINYKSPIT